MSNMWQSKVVRRMWGAFLLSIFFVTVENSPAFAQPTPPCIAMSYEVGHDSAHSGVGFPVNITPGYRDTSINAVPGPVVVVSTETVGFIPTGRNFRTLSELSIQPPCGLPVTLQIFYDGQPQHRLICCIPPGIGTRGICYEIDLTYDANGCPHLKITIK